MGVTLFSKGFRAFFLAAGIFSLLSMGAWMAIWTGWYQPELPGIRPAQWHAHEMVYGYGMAVIAGFLLTAIRNWTGLPTLQGGALAALLLVWSIARIAFCAGGQLIIVAAVTDLLFAVMLTLACGLPLVRARQWRQMAILSKLVLLGIGNALCYLGAFGVLDERGMHWGLYGGFYVVIALILTMLRRMIPAFTENALRPAVPLRNALWLDLSSLVLLLVFWIAEVFLLWYNVAAVTSALMFLVNVRRLGFWYRPGIWRRPLLWSMHLSFALITLAFLLRALTPVFAIPPSLALHTFAIGGIGLITLSMMARVGLGHTGRNVQAPPRIAAPMFALLVVATALRVLGPLVHPAAYGDWIVAAQVAWILGFALFAIVWLPMLTRPRVDGAPG